eukprot:311080_1
MISNVQTNFFGQERRLDTKNRLNTSKLFANLNNVRLSDCMMIYQTLMETKHLNHIVNKDIAKLMTEYAVHMKLNCSECDREYIINDSDEWNVYKYAKTVNPNTFYSNEQNIIIKEINPMDNQYEILCIGCHTGWRCIDCGKMIWQDSDGQTHCDAEWDDHGLCSDCENIYLKKIQQYELSIYEADSAWFGSCVKCRFRYNQVQFDRVDMFRGLL